MTKYIRDYCPGDLEYLTENLREADVAELYAATGLPTYETLKLSIEVSDIIKIIDFDGYPSGIYGATQISDNYGSIWMVATDNIYNHRMKFLKHCKSGIRELFQHTQCDMLMNYTHAANTAHHQWLNWCGAAFLRRLPYGVSNEEFIEFIILRNQYHV